MALVHVKASLQGIGEALEKQLAGLLTGTVAPTPRFVGNIEATILLFTILANAAEAADDANPIKVATDGVQAAEQAKRVLYEGLKAGADIAGKEPN